MTKVKRQIAGKQKPALGTYLQELRQIVGKSLRRVEDETGISNAYLSQLERGVAENPSPHLLQKLADYYGIPYNALMAQAGYLRPTSADKSPGPSSLEILVRTANLSNEEEQEVKKYILFLKSKK